MLNRDVTTLRMIRNRTTAGFFCVIMLLFGVWLLI